MDLSSYTIKNLKTKCKDLGIKGYSNKKKSDLIQLISNKLNNSENQNKQEKKEDKNEILSILPQNKSEDSKEFKNIVKIGEISIDRRNFVYFPMMDNGS